MNMSKGSAEVRTIETVSFQVTVCDEAETILQELNQRFPVIIPTGEYTPLFRQHTADILRLTLANGRPIGFITFPNDDGAAEQHMLEMISQHELMFNGKAAKLFSDFRIALLPNETFSGLVVIEQEPISQPQLKIEDTMDAYLTVLSTHWQTR